MRREHAIGGALLAAFAAACVGSALCYSPVHDEPLHLVGGLTLWTSNDHRLNLEHGPLTRRVLALPAWLLGAEPTRLDDPRWRTVEEMGIPYSAAVYGDWGGPAAWRRTVATRLVNIVLAVLLGAALWRWSRALFGAAGGLWTLAFYCLCPTVLGLAAVGTSDIAAALGFVLAMRAWQACVARAADAAKANAWLRRTGPAPRALGWAGLSALATGALFVTKLSAPLFVAAAMLFALCRSRGLRARPARWWLGMVLLHGVAVWAAVWAAHGFRWEMHAGDATLGETWEDVRPALGAAAGPAEFLRSRRLLPQAFLYGVAYTAKHGPERIAYLNGEYTTRRFPLYFPAATFLKTPPATLALWLLAGWVWLTARGAWRLRAAAPALLGLASFAGAMAAAPNIGVRHVLPAFCCFHVLLGMLARRGRGTRLALALAAALAAVDVAAIHPRCLSYFTPLVGGWRQGHRHLVESNLDWEQDLFPLARWLEQPRPRPAHCLWLAAVDPAVFGIKVPRMMAAEGLPSAAYFAPDRDLGGDYAFAATPAMSPPIPTAQCRELLAAQAAALRARSERTPADAAEFMVLARVALQLLNRERAPDERVGTSILVHRLTDAEVRAAVFGALGPGTPPTDPAFPRR